MKTSDFFDAFEGLKIQLSEREKEALEKKFDPLTSGTVTLTELA